ncbi:hypothetical protein ACOMHN_062578 [Nucella lapillus]
MAASASRRRGPNILITGTPGTGKTTLAEQLAGHTKMVHINVSKLAIDAQLLDGYDEDLNSPILDDDKVLDRMEGQLSQGGCIVEYHSCDFFPERWFDAIFVLRTDTSLLHDRLQRREYSAKKLESNMQCEIFQTILEEACESYKREIVHEVQSDSLEQLQENEQSIVQWIQQWRADNGMVEL